VAPPGQTVELLSWISVRVRTYDETIDVWKTNCPGLSVWDDAITEGLVNVERDPGNGQIVTLTPAGRAALRARPRRALAT
jgi:D-3-phosphoglycerate dehydrogenase